MPKPFKEAEKPLDNQTPLALRDLALQADLLLYRNPVTSLIKDNAASHFSHDEIKAVFGSNWVKQDQTMRELVNGFPRINELVNPRLDIHFSPDFPHILTILISNTNLSVTLREIEHVTILFLFFTELYLSRKITLFVLNNLLEAVLEQSVLPTRKFWNDHVATTLKSKS